MLDLAGLSSVSLRFACPVCGTVTGGVTVGLVTVHGSALGGRLGPVVGDVLFDQSGFRQDEVNV